MRSIGGQVSDFLVWAVASETRPGETECGDTHVVRSFEDGALVAVLDGLGHGPDAAAASRRAADTLMSSATRSVERLVRDCHQALIGTRGAVISLALFNVPDDTLTWLAVGDVRGRVLGQHAGSMSVRGHLVERGGIVGSGLPALHASTIPVGPADLLVLATDGIRPGYIDAMLSNSTASPQQLANDVLADYATGTDDALVLVARYNGEGAGGG